MVENIAPFNRAVQIAKGEIFICLDSDDLLYRNFIENYCMVL